MTSICIWAKKEKKDVISLFSFIVLIVLLLIISLLISYWDFLIEELRIKITSATLDSAKRRPRIQRDPFTPIFEFNTTHLWSIRLADKDYFRLARLLSCRTVIYTGGPTNDTVDSCDHSLTGEFSIQTTLNTQKWLFDHQHPSNCSDKKFAIINNYAMSGFGSTLHQIVGSLSKAINEGRIAVYASPGNWLYGDCSLGNPDCFFLPISNCSVPSKVDGDTTIELEAIGGHWPGPMQGTVFHNRSFNWYRSQLLFYLTRYNDRTLEYVQRTIAQNFLPNSLDIQRPFIAVYVRRSDKLLYGEMSQAYTLKQYFDLFDADAHRANITTVYLNSEDIQIFRDFAQLNEAKGQYYKLLSIETSKDIFYRKLIAMSGRKRGKIVLEFLTDLFIEVNADLHSGTLTSNWCRLVDEIRLVVGKTIPFYTPEHRYLTDARRR